MSVTPSTMLPLGTRAPDFELVDAVSGKKMSLHTLKSNQATVIMFISNHCPYVVHLQKALVDIANEYQQKDIVFVAICSNDIENYPADAPDKMKTVAKQLGYPFPYLFDETQTVARAYDAACTPDFYIFDKNLACVYRGRFDDSSPGKKEVPVTGKDLRAALEAILAGNPVDSHQKPSHGCNIKWKTKECTQINR